MPVLIQAARATQTAEPSDPHHASMPRPLSRGRSLRLRHQPRARCPARKAAAHGIGQGPVRRRVVMQIDCRAAKGDDEKQSGSGLEGHVVDVVKRRSSAVVALED